MAEERVQRRLAAILAADVVGYSRFMEADEAGTLARLNTLRKEVFDPKLAEYGGRIVKTMGDGVLVEFASAVDAVQHAVEVQRDLAKRNEAVSSDFRIELRIGINVGDIIVEEEDIFGDGVNIAARLEGLADPGGICISGTVFDQIGKKLELPYDDLGEQSVKNISEPVRTYRVRIESGVSTITAAKAGHGEALPLPVKPSIAVMPFEDLSGDPEQEYFSDGITEDIITALSRVRRFFVIGRNSTFAYKGKNQDIRDIGRELGVRYILEGSVRKASNRIRLTAQLLDGSSGNYLWAERYDRNLEDIFDLQDELTQTVVGAIEPELNKAEQERARLKKPENLDVWDLYQRGLWHINRRNREDTVEAADLFNRAMEMDPNFGPAFAGYAWSFQINALFGIAEMDARKAKSAALKAVELDGDDPFAHFALATIYNTERNHEAAVEEIQSAIQLNPSYADAYHRLAYTLIHLGRPQEAIGHLDTCIRLSPHDVVVGVCYSGYCLAWLYMHDYTQAVEWGRKAIRQPVVPWLAYAFLIPALAHSGDVEEAKLVSKKLQSVLPDISISFIKDRIHTVHEESLELLLEGFRKADWEG